MNLTCCFCGNKISTTEMDPLVIEIRSEGTGKDYREGAQSFYCHAKCFEQRLYDKDVPFMWFTEVQP